jgi:hypothetical protein
VGSIEYKPKITSNLVCVRCKDMQGVCRCRVPVFITTAKFLELDDHNERVYLTSPEYKRMQETSGKHKTHV